MKKGEGTPENRETPFKAYARFGGKNVPAVLGKPEGRGIAKNPCFLYLFCNIFNASFFRHGKQDREFWTSLIDVET